MAGYVDEKAADHIRVNYVLRGMVLPAGDHKVEFRFHPRSYYTGQNISLISSLLILLAMAGFAVNWFLKGRRK